MNLEFDKYRKLLEEDDDRPLFTEDYIAQWEDLDPHHVTDDESKILEKVKKNEKATLRLIIPILALLTVCFGYFLIVIPDRQLKFILMVIMLLFGLGWYAVFYMIHTSNGNEHDNLVYGYLTKINTKKTRRDGKTYTKYYATFYIPTAQKYYTNVLLSRSEMEKLEKYKHAALFSFRIGVVSFAIVNDRGELV